MERLNIMIVTEDLYPHMNANSEIAYRIGNELQNHLNCAVTIVGMYARLEDRGISNPYSLRTVAVDSMNKYQLIIDRKESMRKRLFRLSFTPEAFRIWYLLWKNKISVPTEFIIENEYIKKIKKEMRKNCFDCIIGFSRPNFIKSVLYRLKSKTPYILYKLDPAVRDYSEISQKEQVLIDNSDANAKAIIVTEFIKRAYYKRIDSRNINKVIALQFPNVVQYCALSGRKGFGNKGKTINCVFAGGLYKGIRTPDYTISLFERLADDGIVLHLYGRLRDGLKLPDKLPCNVVFHGDVASEEALMYMQAADILVNIGNTLSNMLPSKILTYISLGKPILNIYKTRECPTLSYLEKYPRVYNLHETDTIRDEDVFQVVDFIKHSVGINVPFEQVHDIYAECTPEFVGKRVYEIIWRVKK